MIMLMYCVRTTNHSFRSRNKRTQPTRSVRRVSGFVPVGIPEM